LRSAARLRSVQAGALAVALSAVVGSTSLYLFTPARAKAHPASTPVQIGVSFSHRRAAALGLDYRKAFRQLEAMHFRVIRLSAYWDEVDSNGYRNLDWLMTEARRSHQPVALALGMKGLGWPEFYIPASAMPLTTLRDSQDVALDPDLKEAALLFVEGTAARYRDNPELVAWQVENEPFNRAGPDNLWIDADFVRQEIAAVKSVDPHDRPVIVNSFSHFNLLFDQASNRDGFDLKSLLGFDGTDAEMQSLNVLGAGDILGLDVYTAIGYQLLGGEHIAHADSNWDDRLESLRHKAQRAGKRAWITEAQAEPWEASQDTWDNPKSTSPAAMRAMFRSLQDAGYSTVLFWGSEYWLWRAAHGDSRWIDTASSLLIQEAHAPSFAQIV
jgi:hypothetical protein